MKKILTILMLTMTMLTFAQKTWTGGWSPAGAPSANDDVIIASPYNTLDNGPFVCRNLTINTTSTVPFTTPILIVKGGTSITVKSSILASTATNFIIEDDGNLIQDGNGNTNVGVITHQRKTNYVRLNDYTYWSSPVANQSYLALPPFGSLRVFTYGAPGWVREWGGTMTVGKGYIAHRPIVFDPNPMQIYTMDFVGVPNSGRININLDSPTDIYLTGNPYPSSLDMDAFINGSPGIRYISLWTHNTAISSSIPGSEAYNYTNDDYATYNLMGGTPARSAAPTGGPIPSQFIGSGQGFFVTASNGHQNFKFDDSMRGTNNSQFFRQTEKSRIWLSITNNTSITRFTLAGYATEATDGYDDKYDADRMGGGVASLYSVLGNKKLAIQGRALPFDNKDVIQLGYQLPVGGLFDIDIYNMDGIFDNGNRPIYLHDLQLGIVHDLREGKYSFTATAGVVENRFVLRFKKPLGYENRIVENETTVIYSQNKNIVIEDSNTTIKEVNIFDLLGREVYSNTDVNANSLNIDNLSIGVLIVKITLEDGSIVERKIIN